MYVLLAPLKKEDDRYIIFKQRFLKRENLNSGVVTLKLILN